MAYVSLAICSIGTMRAQGFNEIGLYIFTGQADGSVPQSTLVRDAMGNLYGVTLKAGDTGCVSPLGAGCGTVFKIDGSDNFSVLHTFSGSPDGANPTAGLIEDSAGNLYGTTLYGGAYHNGTIYEVNSSTGKETVLYSFLGGPDGAFPMSGLVADAQAIFTVRLGRVAGTDVSTVSDVERFFDSTRMERQLSTGSREEWMERCLPRI